MKSDINPAVLAGSRPAQAMTSTSANEPPRDRRLYLKVMSTIRWLHIYLSMFGFTALVFFAITGITLNHSAWFGLEGEYVQDVTGKLDTKLLSPGGEESSVDKLMIVEALRKQHSLSGAVAEFRTDETECFVSFKGPGFAADAFITRESGEYQLSIARHGVVAIMNDLHKGEIPGGLVGAHRRVGDSDDAQFRHWHAAADLPQTHPILRIHDGHRWHRCTDRRLQVAGSLTRG